MDGDSFYITLPSDASLELHPSNHGGDFTVELPTQLQVTSHQWIAGLCEIIFNQDYSGLIKEDIWVIICINDKTGGTWSQCCEETLTNEEAVYHYTSSQEFVTRALEALLLRAIKKADLAGSCKLELDTNSKLKLTATLEHSTQMPLRLEFSSTLLQILGFARSQLHEERYFQTGINGLLESPRGRFKVKIKRAITSLWVYTDIIESHITGHSLTPLLRVIPIDSTKENDASRVIQFERPYYFRVNVDNIQHVSIQIYNAGGRKPLIFATPVVCKFHFRKLKV